MSDRGRKGGFAFALVVLMLFAIAMAGVAGYQAISTELVLSIQNRDGQKALTVARAGLQRFLGEQIGTLGPPTNYAIGDGVATITVRRVVGRDSLNQLYYIRSTGTVTDPAAPANPAQRSVGTYAWQRRAPIPLKGAFWVSGGTVDLSMNSTYTWLASAVDGHDHSTAADCPGGGTPGTAGLVVGGSVMTSGGTLSGNPGLRSYPGFAAVYDSAQVRWDILSSASFPVDFDDWFPDFGSLPADSFPIVRIHGDRVVGSEGAGRGVLIVTGTLVPAYGFAWDGIILAGGIGATTAPFQVNGMLIAGLNGSNPSVRFEAGQVYFNACDAYAANAALSYLDVVDRAIFEING